MRSDQDRTNRAAPSDPWLGLVLKHKYQLERLLGAGGFGAVYAARQLLLGTWHAVKVLHAPNGSELELVNRFREEARIGTRLRHPRIVAVTDFDVEDGSFFLVMDLIESVTLARQFRQAPDATNLPIEPWVRDIAAALDYAHAQGVIHRDLKPANVLIRDEDQAALLTDFGISRWLHSVGLTNSGMTLGTYAYMSPEQCSGEERAIDARSDIYSFAAVLFELECGRPPFGTGQEAMAGHLHGPVPSVRDSRPDHPAVEQLDAVFARGLAKSPNQRPQSAEELAEGFLGARAGISPAPPAGLRPLNARGPSRLPRYRNTLVGRTDEMEQLADRLEESSIVTLTGPGGIGKTRLAAEVSARLSDRYQDGVVFVDLSPLTDQSLVPRTIASTLGLRDDAVREPMEVITTYLEQRSLLLVLDNCEHVLGAAATAAAELLGECPDLAILATSQEALGVSGETIWEVPPLASRRDPSAAGPLDTNAGDAVELFRVRAEAAAPKSFVWNESALVDATQICRKLDGIPLAIELAAARIRVLPPKDLLAGLNERFALLTTGSNTAMPRQRSLEATVDWSYELLSPTEKMVLERLAVFAGGFSPGAAEAVGADDQSPSPGVVPTLFSLVEKSLIQHGAGVDGSARYSMLETIREYSRSKLRARGTSVDVERRHAAYFSAMASPTDAELRSSRQVEWLAQLEQEYDNFRTAFEWALEKEPLLALDIATKLAWFWVRRHPGEGATWVSRAMAAEAPSGELRARALELAGRLAWGKGEMELARALLTDATEAWANLGDGPRAAHTTGLLGNIIFESGDHELGLEHQNRAVEHLRPLEDHWRLAYVLNNLGWYQHIRGDPSTATPLLHEALQHARQSEDPFLMGIVLDSLAEIEEALGLHHEARPHLQECLELAVRLDDARLAGGAFRGWARLALFEDNPEVCIRLMAAGDAALSSIGAAVTLLDREGLDATINSARSQLSDDVADRAWREGQAMTVREAVASVVGSTTAAS